MVDVAGISCSGREMEVVRLAVEDDLETIFASAGWRRNAALHAGEF